VREAEIEEAEAEARFEHADRREHGPDRGQERATASGEQEAHGDRGGRELDAEQVEWGELVQRNLRQHRCDRPRRSGGEGQRNRQSADHGR